MPDQAAQVLASLAEGLNVEKQEAYEDQEFLDDEVDDPPLDRSVASSSSWPFLHVKLLYKLVLRLLRVG